MALIPVVKTGDLSLAASYNRFTNESDMADATADEEVTSSFKYSPTFTAPNTSNASTHACWFMDNSTSVSTADPPSDSTFELNLEEFDGATWTQVAAAEFDWSDLETTNISRTQIDNAYNIVLVKWATPYTFTTTTSNYYRIGIREKTVIAGSVRLYIKENSNGYMLYGVDDRTGLPAATDDLIITGPVNESQIVATYTAGTYSIGSDSFGTYTNSQGYFNSGIEVFDNAKLVFDDSSGNITLNIDGHLGFRGCSNVNFEIGTEGSPITNTVTLNFDTTSTYRRIAQRVYDGMVTDIHGTLPATILFDVVSGGAGTTADPLITTQSVDWSVGDEVGFLPGTNDFNNYTQSEKKFIRTKNSSTSYTLADTSGGAESGLTYSHDNAHVYNLTRNIVITASNIASGRYVEWEIAGSSIADQSQTLRIENFRHNAPGSGGITIDFRYFNASSYFRNFVTYQSQSGTSIQASNGNANILFNTIDGQFDYGAGSSLSTYAISFQSGDTMTLKNGVYTNYRLAFNQVFRVSNVTIDNVIIGGAGVSSSAGGITFEGDVSTARLINSEIYACRYGVELDGNFRNSQIINCELGTRYKFPNGVLIDLNNVAEWTFTDCNFDPLSTAPNLANRPNQPGGIYAYHRYNQEANNHIYTTSDGEARSTGSGLSDTTIRGTDSLALRIEPSSGKTFRQQFKVPAFANKAVSVFGYARRNSAMTSTITMELFLPNNLTATPDVTTTLGTATDEWILFSLVADYQSSENNQADVIISVPYDQPGGYLYLDDFLNGTNTFTGLDAWNLGRPPAILFADATDPSAPWGVSTQSFASGTTGEMLVRIARDAYNGSVGTLIDVLRGKSG